MGSELTGLYLKGCLHHRQAVYISRHWLIPEGTVSPGQQNIRLQQAKDLANILYKSG